MLSTDVSEIRTQIGKTALGMLSSLLLALITWAAVQVWATKLDVSTYTDHLAQDAMHDKLDSIHAARQDWQIAQVRCTVHIAKCARKHP